MYLEKYFNNDDKILDVMFMKLSRLSLILLSDLNLSMYIFIVKLSLFYNKI
jgi:hypothetical protein